MNKTVFVGISGGVDSSVSALLLKQAGYQVIGVFIRTWQPEGTVCTWREERRDAIRICATLDIPFLECDGIDAYKKGVADYMIREYQAGRTPNPDVMCNREVKFGVFWDFARRHGADYIATGHYAQNKDNTLVRGIDTTKDQSYFLWTLTSEDLAHTLFPVGHLEKKEVRALAKKYNLLTAEKKDSQGVCFLGPIDMKEFLKETLGTTPGDIVNESGEVIGSHDGSLLYTLGERHGFTITKKTSNDDRYYVIAKDIANNTITVGHNPARAMEDTHGILTLTNVVLRTPLDDKPYDIQVRHLGTTTRATLTKEGDTLTVTCIDPVPLVASGQSIVIYRDTVCIGGGVRR